MRDVDFLPDRVKAQRARQRRLTFQAGLMAICLLGLVVLGYVFHVRVASARAELAMLESRKEAVQRQLTMKAGLEGELADLMIKRRIEDQLGRRLSTLDVLGELQRVMPKSMALTRLSMETVEVRLAAKPAAAGPANRAVAPAPKEERLVKRVRLTLTGMAPTDVDVANFIGQLAGSKAFEDVRMGYARNVEFQSRAARQFQVSCYVIR